MTQQLETRSVQIREADQEQREVRGIAVPWDEQANIAGVYLEQHQRGSLEPHPAGVKLYDQHHQIVGTVRGEDTDAGHEIVGTVARTRAGDDFLELVRSGAYGHLSIGFEPIEHTIQERDGELPIVTRTRSVLGEVSGVPFPAYAGATVTEIRSAASAVESTRNEGDNMPEQDGVTYADAESVAEVRTEIQELGRRMDQSLGELQGRQSPAVSQFRSAGELLKALAAGDEAARQELRAADATPPATFAQAGGDAGSPGWMQRPLRFVQERRRIINMLSRDSLPKLGMKVDYPQVASTSGTVAKQAAEGDALSYMEVELDNGTANVGTYGGYSQLSRQAIERGNPEYLSGVFMYQAIQYAKATNAAARAALMAVAGPSVVLGGTAPGVTFDAAKAADWIGVIVDAAAAIEDDSLGLFADFIVCGRDVFKSIATIVDASERPVFALPNGGQAVNVAGNANPVTAQFNIAGLPGFVDPGLAAGTCKVASAEAVTTLESPGAPFRLEDEDIVKLTKDFSLYGYAAWTENDANGVVTIDGDGV